MTTARLPDSLMPLTTSAAVESNPKEVALAVGKTPLCHTARLQNTVSGNKRIVGAGSGTASIGPLGSWRHSTPYHGDPLLP